MNTFKVFSVALLALTLASCGKKSEATPPSSDTSAKDSTAVIARPDSASARQATAAQAPEAAAAEPSTAVNADQVRSFLQDFYKKYVFFTQKSHMSLKEAVQQSCTKSLQKHLQEAYEYECDNGPCYATWCFRTGLQDGPSDVSKIISIVPQKDDWFKVTYLDMGTKASTRIHFVLVNGKLKMDKIKEAHVNI